MHKFKLGDMVYLHAQSNQFWGERIQIGYITHKFPNGKYLFKRVIRLNHDDGREKIDFIEGVSSDYPAVEVAEQDINLLPNIHKGIVLRYFVKLFGKEEEIK